MWIIKSINEEHLHELVNIHLDSFENFFLSKLGKKFLYAFYDTVRRDHNSVLIGVFNSEDNKIAGFCAATFLSKNYYKRLLLNNKFIYLRISIPLIFTKPHFLIRLAKNLTKKSQNTADDFLYAELLSIAIAKKNQGKGLGKLILKKLEEILIENKCQRLSLTTDLNQNDKSIEFYKGLGFSNYYQFSTYPNRAMLRLIKSLN